MCTLRLRRVGLGRNCGKARTVARRGRALDSEILAEIDPSCLWVVDQSLGSSFDENFASVDEVRAVGDAERFAHVMVGDKDGEVTLFEFANNLLHVGNSDGIDPREGFVKKNEGGAGDKRASDFEAAAFATGESIRTTFREALNAKFLKEFVGAPIHFRARDGERFEDGHDVFVGGEAAEDGRFLREVSDAHLSAFTHRYARDVLVVENDPSLCGTDDTNDHIKGGGFSGAVGTEKANNLTGVDLNVDTVDDVALIVGFDKAVGTEDGVSSGRHGKKNYERLQALEVAIFAFEVISNEGTELHAALKGKLFTNKVVDDGIGGNFAATAFAGDGISRDADCFCGALPFTLLTAHGTVAHFDADIAGGDDVRELLWVRGTLYVLVRSDPIGAENDVAKGDDDIVRADEAALVREIVHAACAHREGWRSGVCRLRGDGQGQQQEDGWNKKTTAK